MKPKKAERINMLCRDAAYEILDNESNKKYMTPDDMEHDITAYADRLFFEFNYTTTEEIIKKWMEKIRGERRRPYLPGMPTHWHHKPQRRYT